MPGTTSTPKKTAPPTHAPAIQTPRWPRNFDQIRKRAEEFYAAHDGLRRMTLNDWLQAEQELKPQIGKPITNHRKNL
jgi:hypothetical protein